MNNNNKNSKDVMPKHQQTDGAGKEMERKHTSPESKQSGSKQAGTGSWSPEKGKGEGERKKMGDECGDKYCK